MGNAGASMTAEQVSQNVDLTGKYAIVTGSSAGIGIETARVLLLRNANVIMACRDKDKMAKVAAEIQQSVDKATQNKSQGKLTQMICDLSSIDSIKEFAAAYKKLNVPLHLLVLNAGNFNTSLKQTKEGFEYTIGCNHFGGYALTMNLLSVLNKTTPSARVVVVSSDLHKSGQLNFDDLDWSKRSFSSLQTYNDSKLANVYFTTELDRKFKEKKMNVTAVCLHPGVIKTELVRDAGALGSFFHFVSTPMLKSIEQGAATTVYCCVAPEIEQNGGAYCVDCQVSKASTLGQSVELAQKLWKVSEERTGFSFEKSLVADDAPASE